jgi:hypothetical protein
MDLPPANPTPHRNRLLRQMLLAGQDGELLGHCGRGQMERCGGRGDRASLLDLTE